MKNLGKVLILLLLCSPGLALELKLYTSPSSPGVNDNFQLILEVTKTKNDNVESIKPPAFKGLEYLGKNSQTSEQISTVNGKLTRVSKSKLLFELIAKEEGSYQVEPIEVLGTSGKTYKTKPYKFTVAKKASGAGPQNNAINPFGSSLFDSFFRRSVPTYNPKYDELSEDEKSFINVEVNKTRVYEGEQVKVSWWLYTIGTLRDINTLQYPDLSGFWKEDTELRSRLDFDPVIKNEIQYNRALLSASSLFPLKSGTGVIDEYESKISVSLPGRFSYSRSKSSIVSSKPINIEVMPLPSPVPSNFTFGVGAFSLKDKIQFLRVKQNEPFNISLKFEGYGNAKVIQVEKALTLPKELSIYDIDEKTQFFKNGTSYKLFNISILPSEEGKFKIPEMVFSFFDPDLEEYYDLSIPEKLLIVEKNSLSSSLSSEDYQGKAEASLESVSAQPIMMSADKAPWSPPYWLWLVLNGLLFTSILVGFIYRRLSSESDKVELKDIVNEYLSRINNYKENGSYRAFGTEINSAIEFIVGQSTLDGSSSYEMNRLIKVSSPRLQREYGERLSELRQKAELLAFAPPEQAESLQTQQSMDTLNQEAKELLLSSCKIIEGD